MDVGHIYHLLGDANSTNWYFESRLSENVTTSKSLLVALKIGDLDPALHQPLLDRLKEIPIANSTRFHERITCRVRIKEALFVLDNEGYINLTSSVDDVEAEATSLAILNKSQGKQTVSRSSGSQA
jgi:hypothetical protein